MKPIKLLVLWSSFESIQNSYNKNLGLRIIFDECIILVFVRKTHMQSCLRITTFYVLQSTRTNAQYATCQAFVPFGGNDNDKT